MQAIESVELGRGTKGLFSIIVPVLNNAGQLQRCIDSFANQSETNKELIIVDGGSTDQTLEVIDKNKHLIAQTISAKDSGVYAAFNHGICLSQGEWILFLGSDDVLWGNDVLLNVSRYLSQNWCGQRVAYGKVVILDDIRNYVETRGVPWSEYENQPIGKWTFEHQGIFHHRSLFQEHGLFDESFRLCGDHDLLLRALQSSKALFLEDTIVASFSLGGASSLPRNLNLMIDEKKKALRNNGISSQSVVSRTVMCKMLIYEILRKLFGVTIADRLVYLAMGIIGRRTRL